MRYGSTVKATTFTSPDWKMKLIRALLFFIPSGSPQTEPLYPRVKKWLLEVNEDGIPVREVALDAHGRPLFRTPDGRDLGFWTDSDMRFASSDLEPLAADEFERCWIDAGARNSFRFEVQKNGNDCDV